VTVVLIKKWFKLSMSYQFSPHVLSNTDFLGKLARSRSINKKHALILQASPDQILSIVEICANILATNFVLNDKQRKKLVKYAEIYRSIARTKKEHTARNKIVKSFNQQGGQLAIAAILAPVLSAIAQNLLEQVIR
jgi:hypothetical protein